jgi:CBS domain-containing protein
MTTTASSPTTKGVFDRPVRRVMRHGVVAVPDHASLESVRRAMADHQVHAVLVENRISGEPLGWVTAAMLLTWMNLEHGPTHAHQAMTERVVTVAPDAPVRDAVAALSRPEVSHVLVRDPGDRVAIGVVTPLDIVGAKED